MKLAPLLIPRRARIVRRIHVWAKRTAWASVVALVTLLLAVEFVPFPKDLLRDPSDATWIRDRNGSLLRMKLGNSERLANPVPFDAMSPWLAAALIAAEDKRFQHHPGIDPIAIARATLQNVTHGRVISGASTISTQIIRMAHPQDRTLSAKLYEAFRALQLERHADKNTIIEHYLNRAPFGANIHGVESASQHWFGKSSEQLSLGEAALLAGLPQSPSRFRPDRHLKPALERRQFVLERMEALGIINAQQHAEAAEFMPDILAQHHPMHAPHFCDMLLAHTSHTGRITSTLDGALQHNVERAVGAHTIDLRTKGIHGTAVVVLDVKTGAVRALVGSPDYTNTQHAGQVNGATAPRSAGSTLKPFLYAEAITHGWLSPSSLVSDSERTYRDYRPGNFDGTHAGVVSAHEALSRSLNLPALGIVTRLGVPAFHARLRDLGLATIDRAPEHYGIPLALGTAEVRLLDLVNAYAVLARGGLWMPVRIQEDAPISPSRRIWSEGVCWLVSNMLSDAHRNEALFGHALDINTPQIAWKTGTSNGYRDAWSIGYNAQYVVGVWIGKPDGGAAPELIGIRSAAPLLGTVFRQLDRGEAGSLPKPSDVVTLPTCTLSGRPASTHCDHSGITPGHFVNAAIPRSCECHPSIAQTIPAATRHHATSTTRLRITSPLPDSTFLHLPDSQGQEVPLQVQGGTPPYFWFVNGTLHPSPSFPLIPGRHRIACADASGAETHTTVVVTTATPF